MRLVKRVISIGNKNATVYHAVADNPMEHELLNFIRDNREQGSALMSKSPEAVQKEISQWVKQFSNSQTARENKISLDDLKKLRYEHVDGDLHPEKTFLYDMYKGNDFKSGKWFNNKEISPDTLGDVTSDLIGEGELKRAYKETYKSLDGYTPEKALVAYNHKFQIDSPNPTMFVKEPTFKKQEVEQPKQQVEQPKQQVEQPADKIPSIEKIQRVLKTPDIKKQTPVQPENRRIEGSFLDMQLKAREQAARQAMASKQEETATTKKPSTAKSSPKQIAINLAEKHAADAKSAYIKFRQTGDDRYLQFANNTWSKMLDVLDSNNLTKLKSEKLKEINEYTTSKTIPEETKLPQVEEKPAQKVVEVEVGKKIKEPPKTIAQQIKENATPPRPPAPVIAEKNPTRKILFEKKAQAMDYYANYIKTGDERYLTQAQKLWTSIQDIGDKYGQKEYADRAMAEIGQHIESQNKLKEKQEKAPIEESKVKKPAPVVKEPVEKPLASDILKSVLSGEGRTVAERAQNKLTPAQTKSVMLNEKNKALASYNKFLETGDQRHLVNISSNVKRIQEIGDKYGFEDHASDLVLDIGQTIHSEEKKRKVLNQQIAELDAADEIPKTAFERKLNESVNVLDNAYNTFATTGGKHYLTAATDAYNRIKNMTSDPTHGKKAQDLLNYFHEYVAPKFKQEVSELLPAKAERFGFLEVKKQPKEEIKQAPIEKQIEKEQVVKQEPTVEKPVEKVVPKKEPVLEKPFENFMPSLDDIFGSFAPSTELQGAVDQGRALTKQPGAKIITPEKEIITPDKTIIQPKVELVDAQGKPISKEDPYLEFNKVIQEKAGELPLAKQTKKGQKLQEEYKLLYEDTVKFREHIVNKENSGISLTDSDKKILKTLSDRWDDLNLKSRQLTETGNVFDTKSGFAHDLYTPQLSKEIISAYANIDPEKAMYILKKYPPQVAERLIGMAATDYAKSQGMQLEDILTHGKTIKEQIPVIMSTEERFASSKNPATGEFEIPLSGKPQILLNKKIENLKNADLVKQDVEHHEDIHADEFLENPKLFDDIDVPDQALALRMKETAPPGLEGASRVRTFHNKAGLAENRMLQKILKGGKYVIPAAIGLGAYSATNKAMAGEYGEAAKEAARTLDPTGAFSVGEELYEGKPLEALKTAGHIGLYLHPTTAPFTLAADTGYLAGQGIALGEQAYKDYQKEEHPFGGSVFEEEWAKQESESKNKQKEWEEKHSEDKPISEMLIKKDLSTDKAIDSFLQTTKPKTFENYVQPATERSDMLDEIMSRDSSSGVDKANKIYRSILAKR